MPVETRSARRKAEREKEHRGGPLNRVRPPSRTSQPQEIFVPITNVGHQDRFVTPVPKNSVHPTTPPKLERHIRSGHAYVPGSLSPPEDDIKDFTETSGAQKGRNLAAEFQRRHYGEGIEVEASPSDNPPRTHRRLAPPFPEQPQANIIPPRPKLGRHGTHLIADASSDSFSSDATVVWQPQARPSIPAHSKGLGPEDTILVGPDGQPIAPGLRDGY
ncbi:hypothetical protein BDZ97DRAFT_1825251 [Flammula alnicola]|nr:hypothetical protein BDZ97DRAFT_1825251 [Flammula alnicola]